MNKKSLVKIINKELTILADFVEGFEESENIHPMEVDLAISKVKDIYDELVLLKGSDAPVVNTIPSPVLEKQKIIEPKEEKPIEVIEPTNIEKNLENKPEEIEEVIEVEEPKVVSSSDSENIENEIVSTETEEFEEEVTPINNIEEENTEEKEDNESVDQSNNSEDVTEPVVEAKKEEEIVNTEISKQPEKSEKKQKKVKGEIIADKFSKDALSINEMLAGIKKNKDLASLLKDSPIVDLKRSIKLNDRIWYINELFNKNASTYENAVETVNSSKDLDSALEYLFTNFEWDQSRKSTISFLELVFRRFAQK